MVSDPTRAFAPRYFEIAQALRARIAHLQPHDQLASDAELCTEFGVSRMTARAAVSQLVNDGLVYREPGRGTFVAPPVVDRQLSNLLGFNAEMLAKGLEPSSLLISAEVVPGTDIQLDKLYLEPGSKVVNIERLRMADGAPLVLDYNALPAKYAGVLETDLNSGSLHSALLAEGAIPAQGTSTITAEGATKQDATYLRVEEGSPLVVERRLIRDPRGTPVEWTESHYVPERYSITAQFTVELPPQT
ncbi:MAG: GntR family transcriptional regulator [Ancrocorticia sp.]|uniref:GntR family transcriptional regulator n=1 Tax=Ancrocorticia sp. TaxID=2593684 RepID=UPI003F908C0C